MNRRKREVAIRDLVSTCNTGIRELFERASAQAEAAGMRTDDFEHFWLNTVISGALAIVLITDPEPMPMERFRWYLGELQDAFNLASSAAREIRGRGE